jgi:(p)ppGpp synthase/HD superfamily hydrolase
MADVIVNLLKKINYYSTNHNIEINIQLINTAINYIKQYHRHQRRHSGEPYYYHPIEVAFIVINYFFDTTTIISALLHDVVEDTNFSINQIKFLFGKEISLLVDRLTKLDNNCVVKFKLSDEESSYKLVNINESDKKVFVIKLCDRLHNMRTIKYIKSIEKRKKIALETLQIFIPIARYVGIKEIEMELKYLAIKTLNVLNENSIEK